MRTVLLVAGGLLCACALHANAQNTTANSPVSPSTAAHRLQQDPAVSEKHTELDQILFGEKRQ